MVLVAVAEAGARLWAPPVEEVLFEGREGVLMRSHPTRMWALRPGRVSGFGVRYDVDEQGLRAGALGASPRILTLGDSSIFGHGVSEDGTLHSHLQAALGAHGVTSTVRTVGVPGYSTEQTLLLMDELGWSLEPDLLVIGNLWSDSNVDGFVDAVWLEQLGSLPQRVENALSVSRLWTLLRSKPEEHHLRIGWIRDPDLEGHRRVPLSSYGRNLDRLVREGASRGVGSVFLAPCNAGRLRGEAAQWDVYFDAMDRVAAHHRLPRVDGCSVLQAAGVAEAEAFSDSLHPTSLVNGLYAAALADALVTAGWPAERLVSEAGAFEGDLVDPWWE